MSELQALKARIDAGEKWSIDLEVAEYELWLSDGQYCVWEIHDGEISYFNDDEFADAMAFVMMKIGSCSAR